MKLTLPMSGADFEREIQHTLDAYHAAMVATMAILPIPSRMVYRKGIMTLVPTGPSPFDVWGYCRIDEVRDGKDVCRRGQIIGAELKSTQGHETLPIVQAASDSKGVEYHQLTALADLYAAGGLAYIVWNNDGEIMVLDGPGIFNAKMTYDDSERMRMGGNKPPKGSRSIHMSRFRTAPRMLFGGIHADHWLGFGV